MVCGYHTPKLFVTPYAITFLEMHDVQKRSVILFITCACNFLQRENAIARIQSEFQFMIILWFGMIIHVVLGEFRAF